MSKTKNTKKIVTKNSKKKKRFFEEKKSLLTKKNISEKNFVPKKKWGVVDRILGLIELGRPIEWSKSLLNMTLAALIGYYCYLSLIDPIIFVLGFFSVALMWSGLYALNDLTDWRIDLIHPVKKNRPIPSGKVTPFQAKIFSFVLIGIGLCIPFLLNNFWLLFCLLFMILNQFLYTMEPYRLKSRKYFDLISGSMVNPVFRYLSGLVLFVSFKKLTTMPFPILPIIFVVGLQFSGYSLYRMFSTKHDKKVKMSSTVALLTTGKIKILSYSAMIIGALAYVLILVNGLTFQEKWLGFLPQQYTLAIFGALLVLPLLKDAILNPKKADMKISYRATYLATILFIIANWIIFFFLR
ncbi:MAG: UbiA family prenyltransferase [Candidatus Diapherotrites archaeon]|jgi:4-hydroxybenzoate polyprenyltransferase|uniref:UbiA family prenyltransferase n=1 Tax=Candidatus Iainarchaeum sp. TaxID=3101447 RepID=A0A7K4BZ86_9ARCH|nr:UbiA family prenyltransferase [Candidatus Diapherotrites archaeon]